jgi:16S rRNA processing protein RimM
VNPENREDEKNLIEVGRVIGAHGIDGWLKIRTYFSEEKLLLNSKNLWIGRQNLEEKPVSIECLKAKSYRSDSILALLANIENRDAAEATRGSAVCMPRSCFPPLDKDEFYWVDLIGLDVKNLMGEYLGVVVNMTDNGAHPILKIVSPTPAPQGKKKLEILIPFVKQFIRAVDQNKERKITVDWDSDW